MSDLDELLDGATVVIEDVDINTRIALKERCRSELAALRASLNDAQVQEYMSRNRGDVLAEINDQLRSEVDTRNVAIDHLEAENARLREALRACHDALVDVGTASESFSVQQNARDKARTALGGSDE